MISVGKGIPATPRRADGRRQGRLQIVAGGAGDSRWRRPGEIERAINGLSKKVMNERLRKLQRYGIVEKRVFAEVPPRVECRLTRFGTKFATLLKGIDRLQQNLDAIRENAAV